MNITENLVTPKDLEKRKILSRATQWKERKNGNLKYFLIGNKVFYSEQQLEDFFKQREQNTGSEK